MESVNKLISAAKPRAYDPINECINPLKISKVTNAERVKLCNKIITQRTVDGKAMQRTSRILTSKN